MRATERFIRTRDEGRGACLTGSVRGYPRAQCRDLEYPTRVVSTRTKAVVDPHGGFCSARSIIFERHQKEQNADGGENGLGYAKPH
jgi:hypothetical protein